jgi:hypothetical protein
MMPGPNVQPSLASYQSSQPSSYHQQQQYMASPEYMRAGTQHMGNPQESVSQANMASANKLGGVAGAVANQRNKFEAESRQEPQISVEEMIEGIENAIKDGRLQHALVLWIQSGHKQEIFHRCLSLQPPSRFEDLPPAVLHLAVIATIANDLGVNNRLKQEIDWIEMAMRSFQRKMSSDVSDSLHGTIPIEYLTNAIFQDPKEQQDLAEAIRSAPKIMQMLINELSPLIALYDSDYPVDPWLANVGRGRMEWIVRSAEGILQALGGPPGYA